MKKRIRKGPTKLGAQKLRSTSIDLKTLLVSKFGTDNFEMVKAVVEAENKQHKLGLTPEGIITEVSRRLRKIDKPFTLTGRPG